MQKLFALLLVLSMTMGMLNITAFATGGDEGAGMEVKLSQTSLSRNAGGAGQTVTASVTEDESGASGTWSWEIDRPGVAEFAVDGTDSAKVTVTALSAGTAVLTATYTPDGEGAQPVAGQCTVGVTQKELVLSYENALATQNDPSQLVGDTLAVSTAPNVSFKLWTLWQTTDPDGTVTYSGFSNTAATKLTVSDAECAQVTAASNTMFVTVAGTAEGTGTVTLSTTDRYTEITYECDLEVTASEDLVGGLYLYGVNGNTVLEPEDGVLSLAVNELTNLKCVPADSSGSRILGASFTGTVPAIALTANSENAVQYTPSTSYLRGLANGTAQFKAELEGYPTLTLTVQVGDPTYTAGLNLYAAEDSGIDAADILAALEEAEVTGASVVQGPAEQYVALPQAEVTDSDLEGYRDAFAPASRTRAPRTLPTPSTASFSGMRSC